jgi:GNAT superfamily N-acetyltransferase
MTVVVDWYSGPRPELRPLFELAEDSTVQLDAYLDLGRVLVGRVDGEIVGHRQLVETRVSGEIELQNMAVDPERQGSGVGRRLVEVALEHGRAERWARLLVSTAAADVGNLRFYQRLGFRMQSIERDAFVPATGYPEPILIDGIALRDRVWLSIDLG